MSQESFLNSMEELYKQHVVRIQKENENLLKQNTQLKEYVLTLTQQLEEQKRYNDLSIVAELNRENDDLRSINTVLTKRVKVLTETVKDELESEHKDELESEHVNEPTKITLESGTYYVNDEGLLFADPAMDEPTNVLKTVKLKTGTSYFLDTQDNHLYHILEGSKVGLLAGKIVDKKAKLY